MAQLALCCLGPFQVTLDGEPVTGIKSNKVRALLAYLAVEADRPHRRESLATLLWPDQPDRNALSNLRYTLSNLRRVIADHDAKPPHLMITRDTLQFNSASDYRLDVTTFLVQTELARKMAAENCDLAPVEEAIALYRGEFLEGFSVSDSLGFEEWAQLKRQQLALQLLSALRFLVTSCERAGQYAPAVTWARRLIELEPWDEAAHQQLMRALALSGRRSAALVQYETCCQLLADELGVEPAPETTRLYEQIRIGKLRGHSPLPAAAPDLPVRQARFLEEEPPPVDTPIFVAREQELAQLDRLLNLAMAGRGRVAFVTGEAGSGKTALIQAFSRRSQKAYADLGVASGNCNAYTGIGDPYLPFREILALLTGDIEAKWSAGAITSDHARRLWDTLPVAAQALVETGQGLLDTFVPRAALLERVTAYANWPEQTELLAWLGELTGQGPVTGRGAPSLRQSDLFEQYTRVMTALAQQSPLLLVVDDLQWADLGSISLLFHLGRHLAGSRILLLSAYRPEEIAWGRDGERHPLEPVVNEFQREFGDITVNVDRAERREFLEAFLDSEPNWLENSFRQMLYRRTHGHPLFTVELLRGMQERGDLVQDDEGRWIEGATLDWETLPARVEAAIAERIGRLDRPLQAALRVASVEGEDFTAEVVARVLRIDEKEMVPQLSSELGRKHRLVRPQVIEHPGVRRVSRYRFRNYLFQKYLYDSLDEVERAYLHEDVGNALEELYGDQEEERAAIAPQLARHFQEARVTEKAIYYLHQAGARAVQLSAYQEGIAHLTKGLALLMTLPDSPERTRIELALQLTLGLAWMRDIPGPEWKNTYTRARELCQQTGETSHLCQILGEMSIFHFVRAEHPRAQELAEEALSLAHEVEDPLLVALSHWHLGFILFNRGEFKEAQTHLEQILTFYKPQEHHHPFLLLRGSDAGASAMAYDACNLWCLGYPDTAQRRGQEALALARELDHPFSLADVLCFAGCMLDSMRGDARALKEHSQELLRLSNEVGLAGWVDAGDRHHGEALAMLGRVQEGIAQMRQGITAGRTKNLRVELPGTLGSLAMAQAKVGQPEQGMTTLAEALAVVEMTDERHREAELYRLRAELLLRQGDEAEAEAALQKAVEIARRQSARSWELRAAMDLACLWEKQDRRNEASQLLGDVYDWFTEGFDTPDLKAARALLERLS